MMFNDPFYFALPRGARFADADEATKHIAAEFGIRGGRVEAMRQELAFTLFRITGWSA